MTGVRARFPDVVVMFDDFVIAGLQTRPVVVERHLHKFFDVAYLVQVLEALYEALGLCWTHINSPTGCEANRKDQSTYCSGPYEPVSPDSHACLDAVPRGWRYSFAT